MTLLLLFSGLLVLRRGSVSSPGDIILYPPPVVVGVAQLASVDVVELFGAAAASSPAATATEGITEIAAAATSAAITTTAAESVGDIAGPLVSTGLGALPAALEPDVSGAIVGTDATPQIALLAASGEPETFGAPLGAQGAEEAPAVQTSGGGGGAWPWHAPLWREPPAREPIKLPAQPCVARIASCSEPEMQGGAVVGERGGELIELPLRAREELPALWLAEPRFSVAGERLELEIAPTFTPAPAIAKTRREQILADRAARGARTTRASRPARVVALHERTTSATAGRTAALRSRVTRRK